MKTCISLLILFSLFEHGIEGCRDENYNCSYWARQGYCKRNPPYMNVNCRRSCNLCGAAGVQGRYPTACSDTYYQCNAWAKIGECRLYPGYMKVYCRKSCGLCGASNNRVITCQYVTCSWASWGSWSATCGRLVRQRRIQERKMTTKRKSCSGLKKQCSEKPESQNRLVLCNCNFVSCHVGQWSSWSTTCGYGGRSRSIKAVRETIKRDSCGGLRQACPKSPENQSRTLKCVCSYVECLRGEWSSWTATCGVAMRKRAVETIRKTSIRESCGALKQSCNSRQEEIDSRNKPQCQCSYVDCIYGAWSSWSGLCGTVERTRRMKPIRKVINHNACEELNRACPDKTDRESTQKECGPSSLCYLDGKTFTIGESYVPKDCSKICRCNEGGRKVCTTLCPPNVLICKSDEYRIETREAINGTNCSCPASKCIKKDASINDPLCGASKKTASSNLFVIGGNPAKQGDWPWMVAVVRMNTPQKIHCGASLLNTQWVLSAAHCFFKKQQSNPKQYILRIGEHTLNRKEIVIERKIKQIVLHENYVDKKFHNDIALLQLDKPIEFTPLAFPVCINRGKLLYPPGVRCIVTGWGRTKREFGPAANVLQELRVPLVPHRQCRDAYLKLKGRDKYWNITENMICAGYSNARKDSCTGDSGGPLVCKTSQDGYWQQVGIVSFGKGCAREGFAGVYTKVGNYFNWIQSQLLN